MKKHRILSHSYRLVHHRISTKDVVLNKQFSSRKLTTEEFFQIDSQPKNTCPMIDPVQTLIEQQMKPLEDICSMELSELRYSDTCDDCSNAEVYEQYLEAAQGAKTDAESYKEQLNEAREYLETLRSDCENLRAHGLKIKGLIWSIPEVEDLVKLREQMVDLIDSAPEAEFSSKEYYSLFPDGDRVSSFDVDSFDSCTNEKCCFNDRMLDGFKDLAKLLPTKSISEEDCSDAMDNYDKISEWVIYLGEKALEAIDDEDAVQNLKDKNDINAFMDEFQRDFDRTYNMYWSWMKAGDLVTSLAEAEAKFRELVPDFDEKTGIEFDLMRDVLSRLKTYAEVMEGISYKTQLEEHKIMTKKIFDELTPKIEAAYSIISAPLKDWKLNQTDPALYQYVTNLIKAHNAINNYKLLSRYSAYQTFIAEEF